MSKKSLTILTCAAASLAAVHLTTVAPAVAQQVDYHHVIDLAGRQSMLSQRMAKEVALVALDYNTRENLRNLAQTYDLFDRTMRGLRYGDIDLALDPVSDPDVLENLQRVEEIWPLFDATVQSALNSGQLSRSQLTAVSDLSMPLLAAMNQTVDSYTELASAGHLFSMLVVAVDLAGTQRTLSQQMAKEYFLVAYGVDAERNRRALSQSVERFDRVLDGLLNGDSDMLLIPAPTRDIQSQLRTVSRLWDELKPILTATAHGGEADADDISLVASMNLSLLNEMNMAVSMYKNL